MKKLSLLLFLIPSLAYSYLIDFSGIVVIGGDLVESDTAIVIAANDVTLDLAGHIITSTGSDGIVIEPGLQNIKIMNGTISNVPGTGLVVGEGCSNISINSINILSCDTAAMDFRGTSGNEIIRSRLSNIQISQSSTSVTASEVIHLNYTYDFQWQTGFIVENGNVSAPLSVVKIENSNRCSFLSVRVRDNIASSLICFDCATSQNCSFRSCIVVDNSGVSGFTGFLFNGSTSINHICESCEVSSNLVTGSLTGPLYGYRFVQAQGIKLSGCSAFNNVNSGTLATSHIFGFYLDQAQACSFMRCNAFYNTAPNAGAHNAAGFFIGTTGGAGTGVKRCTFIGNEATGNASNSDSTSFGFLATSGALGNQFNAYISNRAYLNGVLTPIVETQIIADQSTGSNPGGVPFNSVKSQTIDKLNGIYDRVSNLRIGG